jgi:4-hydroxy-3-polyprenylbenzoate decarboxylase
MKKSPRPEDHNSPESLSRRDFLAVTGTGLALTGALGGCATAGSGKSAAGAGQASATPSPTAPFDSLRDYVAAMEARGNVLRIAQVDQDAYEGTALMYRLVDRYGIYRAPIVIFEAVKINGQWLQGPVIANQLRHVETETLLFGIEPVAHDNSATWRRSRAHLDALLIQGDGKYPTIAPIEVAADSAPCKEVVLEGDAIDILSFPFFRNNPGDSGRFINTTSVITSDPEMGINFGTYRCELKGPRHIAVGSGEGQTGYTMLMRAKERGETVVPITLIVGMDPMVWLVSGSRVTGRQGKKPVNELATAGGLRGKAIEVVKCDTNDFLVPAGCEMVIEGEVQLGGFEVNGPYGEGSGYIGAPYETAFTMTIKRITHRRNPWIVNDFTGVTRPMIEQPSAALTVAGLQTLIPNIKDYRYQDSVTWISIAKDKPGQALETGKRLAKMIPVFKIVIMVDADVDLWNDSDRFMAFATRWQAWPASYIYEELRTMPLEPSSPKREQTSKVVIDATRQWPEEGGPQHFPDYSRQVLEQYAPDLFSAVDAKWGAQINGQYNPKA